MAILTTRLREDDSVAHICLGVLTATASTFLHDL